MIHIYPTQPKNNVNCQDHNTEEYLSFWWRGFFNVQYQLSMSRSRRPGQRLTSWPNDEIIWTETRCETSSASMIVTILNCKNRKSATSYKLRWIIRLNFYTWVIMCARNNHRLTSPWAIVFSLRLRCECSTSKRGGYYTARALFTVVPRAFPALKMALQTERLLHLLK